jgi:hypothetical protein
VEDDAFVRNVAYEILLAARNAADAVCAFRGHPDRVQLLLTDVVLPDRDGCDLARELGKIESGLKAIFHLRLSGKFRHPAGASASPLALFAQTIFRFAVTAESQGSRERVIDGIGLGLQKSSTTKDTKETEGKP